jgi:hypothetical protein
MKQPALNRKRKLAIMLTVVGASLAFSGYNFYRSLRPKIVEKTVIVTVEKPVDRVVEKVVHTDCPKKTTTKQITELCTSPVMTLRIRNTKRPVFLTPNPPGQHQHPSQAANN